MRNFRYTVDLPQGWLGPPGLGVAATAAFTIVPEPGVGLLVGLGLLALSARAGDYVGRPVRKFTGEIISVDAGEGSFNIKPRRAEKELTVLVDENTRFKSRDGDLEGLDDLEPEMIAIVAVKKGEDGELLAVVVAASTKDDLPKFETRVGGKVTEVENNSFTIMRRDGQEVSILVTGDTKFRSRGDKVQSLDDLEPDMIVVVGGKELGNGKHQYQAQLVLVGKK